MTLSRWVLNISREGDSTASLGSLGQGSITLRGKKFFLMFRWKMMRKKTLGMVNSSRFLGQNPQKTSLQVSGETSTLTLGLAIRPEKLPVPCTSRVCMSQRFTRRDRVSILHVLIYGDNLHDEILRLSQSPAGTNYWACKWACPHRRGRALPPRVEDLNTFCPRSRAWRGGGERSRLAWGDGGCSSRFPPGHAFVRELKLKLTRAESC